MHSEGNSRHPSSQHTQIPALVVKVRTLRFASVQRRDVQVTSSRNPVVDNHASADRHEENRVRAQKSEERRRGSNDLPWNE